MARECFCCAAVVSIFCPPLAVLMLEGCGVDFCINFLLTCLGWIPGIIHACCVLSRPEPTLHVIHTQTQYVQPAAPVVVHVQASHQQQHQQHYQQQYHQQS